MFTNLLLSTIQRFFAFEQTTNFDELLDAPTVTLEDVLDEDGLIS